MNTLRHAEDLRILSREYYQGHISFVEYREKRNIVLDDMDEEYNGSEIIRSDGSGEDSSFLAKAIGLFKITDSSE